MHTRRLLLGLGFLLVGCGSAPSARPMVSGGPPRGTGPVVPPPPPEPVAHAPAREVAVGALCPASVGGRPGVRLVAARKSLGWTDDPAELEELLRRGRVDIFTVLGPAGARVGTFTAAGLESDAPAPTAVGSYAGAAVCDGAPRTCPALTDGCGLAVALITRPGEGESLNVRAGGACIDKGTVYVDVDGDGNSIGFPASAFLDETRAPAEEIIGNPAGVAPCAMSFQAPGVAAHSKDPKAFQGADVVAVADLDDDGKLELVVVLRYGDRRTWALFGVGQSERQMVRLAEGAR